MLQQLYEYTMDGLTIDRCVRDCGFNMPSRHFHSHYEIYFLAEGERFYFIDKKTYLVRPGSLVFIDRNQIHKTGSTGTGPDEHNRILLQLDGDRFLPYLTLAGLQLEQFFHHHCGVLDLTPTARVYVEHLLDSIAAELEQKAAGYEFLVRSRVMELLIFARRQIKLQNDSPDSRPVKTARYRKVDEVAGYIAAHYDSPESLDSLSRRFYVSKCYLSRIFKEVTGFTVNEYISIHRIKQAQLLLTTTDYNITEIADQLGYESITYFEKIFKRYTSVSPLRYRKQQKALENPEVTF